MKDSRTGILTSTAMVDFETFLTTLDGMLDAFGKAHLPADWHPGVRAALTRSEVLTLAIASQWQGLGSERGFYRAAQRQLRAAVPPLPDRSQCTRLLRQHADAVVVCGRYLGPCLQAQPGVDEAVDGTAAPTGEANRRGQGWLPGRAFRPGWPPRWPYTTFASG